MNKYNNNKKQNSKHYLINEKIPYNELRIISDTGENIGVVLKNNAIELAKSKGLDLVLITKETTPPVAKIVNFDKFRYQQEKEEKRKKIKQPELKHIRISARSAKNDLMVQIKKINTFLEKGNNIEILLRLRGREKANKDWAKMKLNDFLSLIEKDFKINIEPKFTNKGLIMQISPK